MMSQAICKYCGQPIWNEGGLIGSRLVETGWSDRNRVDSLVCFRAMNYRHVPIETDER